MLFLTSLYHEHSYKSKCRKVQERGYSEIRTKSKKGIDNALLICYNNNVNGALAQLGAHNTGSVGVRGSNPLCSTNKKRTFVYRQMFSFCLSKPQAWHIIAARSVVYIISPCGAVSHHASACISLRLDDIQPYGLMIYRNKLRMIYKAYALIYLRKCDIME